MKELKMYSVKKSEKATHCMKPNTEHAREGQAIEIVKRKKKVSGWQEIWGQEG